MHPTEAIANYFLKSAWNENKDLAPIQVIKLTYIAHGWTLGYIQKPLVYSDVEAWRYGPVFRRLYNQLKSYGDQPIDSLIEDESNEPYKADFSPEETTILDAVWDHYKDIEGIRLSALTHAEGTPWYQVWHKEKILLQGYEIIPNYLIQQYYKGIISNPQKQ